MEDNQTLILSKKDVGRCLDIDDVLQIVEETLSAHGQEEVVLPPKISLSLGNDKEWPHYNGFINAMPAYIGPLDVAGIKWAGGFWNNFQKGLPSIMAIIILNDPETGVPLAILDGAWITDFRTAAVSAVAAKYLAQENIKRVGIFGAGTQGKTHLSIFDSIYDLKEAKIFDIKKEALRKFEEEMQEKVAARITLADTVEETSKGADVLITVTTSKKPFLKSQHLSQGVHISAMGSYNEITKGVVEDSNKVIVDNLEQAKHRGNLARFFESGELDQETISGELGDVVAGKVPGRQDPNENTLVVPIGMGSLDVAIANKAFEVALEKQVGTFTSFDVEASSIT